MFALVVLGKIILHIMCLRFSRAIQYLVVILKKINGENLTTHGKKIGKGVLAMSEEKIEEQQKQELSQLETEFQKTYKEIIPLIKAELKEAKAAIKRAIALAEKHGVPFTSPVSLWISDTYIPESFEVLRGKMEELDDEDEIRERLEEFLGFYPQNWNTGESGWESEGWRSSGLTC